MGWDDGEEGLGLPVVYRPLMCENVAEGESVVRKLEVEVGGARQRFWEGGWKGAGRPAAVREEGFLSRVGVSIYGFWSEDWMLTYPSHGEVDVHEPEDRMLLARGGRF